MASFKNPPKWALSVLQYICPPDLIEEIEGDLFEAYQWRISQKGIAYAQRTYIFEVLRCLRYYKIRFQTQNNGLMLLQNYFKTGFRFLWKTRGYSSLNILGLALGIAVCWLAYIFVTDEYSFDAYHENADRIYRTTASVSDANFSDVFAGSSYVMGQEFPANVPEIQKSSRFKSGFSLLKDGADYFRQGFHYADPAFFEMFDVDFVAGQPGDFSQTGSVVISQQMAERLGIGNDLVNKEIILRMRGEDRTYSISGVYKTFPTNSSIRPQILVPFQVWANDNPDRLTNWFDINMNVFFMLDKQTDPTLVAQKITDLMLENEDFGEAKVALGLQPYTDIHLNPAYETGNGINARGDNQFILIVAIVGLLCLIIACVNYATFSVGNYIVRLKEVAVRKVFGAQRKSVFKQFVTETFISAFIGLILSVGIILLLLPGFAEYANKSYDMSMVFNNQALLGGLLILILVTLISGIYPALLLSGFSTINGLKGKSKVSGKSVLTKFLVVLQFGISIFLIAGMLSVNKQLNYLLNLELGYSGDNLIQLFRPINNPDQIVRYKNDMKRISGVNQVALASGFNGTHLELDDGKQIEVRHARVDEDFIEVMGISLLQGRDFNPEMPTDKNSALIVNEAFLRETGIENPLGYETKFNYGEMEGATIIGVVADFYFDSPKGNIEPAVMYMSAQLPYYDHLIKVNPNTDNILSELEAVYKDHFAPVPFSYSFVEDDIAAQYELETNIRKISRAGAVAAIFLTCLGLMGFVGTQIRQRMKEVSIRKVIGAEPGQIFQLFSLRYILLIVVGFVIGLSTAYWLVKQWLEGYANNVGFTLDTGLITLIMIVTVAVLTIFSQLYRAMFLNPVTYLKEE